MTITPTALAHLEEAVRTTARKWGREQAKTYDAALEEGFKEIAKQGTSHWWIFVPTREKRIFPAPLSSIIMPVQGIIHHVAGIFQASNIPVGLAAATESRGEISDLREEIGKEAKQQQLPKLRPRMRGPVRR